MVNDGEKVFSSETLAKEYNTMLCIASRISRMQEEQGYVDIGMLISEYSEFLDFISDPDKCVDLVAHIYQRAGRIKLRWDGLEPKEKFSVSDVKKLNYFQVKVLSSKYVVTNRAGKYQEFYEGSLMLGNKKFGYVSLWELPLRDIRVWAIPIITTEEKKKRGDIVYRITFDVLSYDDEFERIRSRLEEVPETFESLEEIRRCFPKIVGEDVNIYLSILSLASRLNENRDFWIMGIVVQGESSSGKSHFMDNILKPYEAMGLVKEFTRFTGAYMERKFSGLDMNHIIIKIYELSRTVPEQLHITLSEGKLTVGLVDKDTGQPVEFTFSGVPFLFSTTPMENIRPDLLNRVVNISIDESDDQTRKIVEFETMLAEDVKTAMKIDSEAEEMAKGLAKYLSSLKSYYVVVPYASKLKALLKQYHVKIRRDWKKLLSLIQASALLFQHNREKRIINDREVLVADWRDLENLSKVMPAFKHTLTSLSEPQQKLLKFMDAMEEWTASDLTKYLHQNGWKISNRRVKQILEELETLGYVVIEKGGAGRGHANIYSKIRGIDEIDLTPLLEELKNQRENT